MLQRVEDSLVVNIQLLLSVSSCPKVITLYGFHGFYSPSNDSSPERPQTAPPPLPRRSPALRPHLPDRQPDATLHATMTSRNKKWMFMAEIKLNFLQFKSHFIIFLQKWGENVHGWNQVKFPSINVTFYHIFFRIFMAEMFEEW